MPFHYREEGKRVGIHKSLFIKEVLLITLFNRLASICFTLCKLKRLRSICLNWLHACNTFLRVYTCTPHAGKVDWFVFTSVTSVDYISHLNDNCNIDNNTGINNVWILNIVC